MKTIKISDITSALLSSGKYKDEFPEYYRLSKIVENNPWHDHQDVFSHSVAVFKGLEDSLQFVFLTKEKKLRLCKYLSQKIDQHSNEDLLRVATLLHDSAKFYLLETKSDGTTSCPGHELMASRQVLSYTSLFGLSLEESQRVEKIIEYHGFVGEIVNYVIKGRIISWAFDFLTLVSPQVVPELLIFFRGDILGSDLKKLNPALFSTFLSTTEKLIAYSTTKL